MISIAGDILNKIKSMNEQSEQITMQIENDQQANGWKNKRGTCEKDYCSCGCCKDHWLNFSNQEWPDQCSVVGCNNRATDGAHMYNSNESMREWIVPTCHKCNTTYDTELPLKNGITLVSANKSITCEK